MSKVLAIPLVVLLVFAASAVYLFTDVPETLGFGDENTAGFNAVYVMRVGQSGAEFDYLSSLYNVTDTYQLSKQRRGEALEMFGKALVERGYVTDLGAYNIQIIGLRRGEDRLIYAHAWCQDIDTGDVDLRRRLVTRMVDDGYRCFLDMTVDANGAITIKPHAYG